MASLSRIPRGKSPKLHRYWQGPYRVVRQISDVLFLLQHRDSRRRRTVVHFDRLKPCVTLILPVATPLEDITVHRDEDREITPLKEANTQQKATITEPPEGVDEPEPLEGEVFRNPVDGKQVVTEEETPAEPPELQVEFRNLAVQPTRKSNRSQKKPERFGHNIYD